VIEVKSWNESLVLFERASMVLIKLLREETCQTQDPPTLSALVERYTTLADCAVVVGGLADLVYSKARLTRREVSKGAQ
jgi:hypothetical protein